MVEVRLCELGTGVNISLLSLLITGFMLTVRLQNG